jgi:predicted nucleic acid-binding protein
MVVLDASVILKWFYPPELEPHSDLALEFRQRFLDGSLTVLIPSFAMYECASSMHHSRYRLPRPAVRGLIRDLWRLPFTVQRLTRRVLWRATEIAGAYGASERNLSVYDAYYFAVAQCAQCPCVTADRKAYTHVEKIPWIHLLRDVSNATVYDD